MRKSVLTGALSLTCVLLLTVNSSAQNRETDWGLFSKALVRAIDSGNYGAKLGALQQIAIYGPKLHVNQAVFDVVRVYRNSRNENDRILALSALAKMRDHWAMDFLSRSVPYEKSERVKRHTIAVVNAYRLGTDRNPTLASWEAHLMPPKKATYIEPISSE